MKTWKKAWILKARVASRDSVLTLVLILDKKVQAQDAAAARAASNNKAVASKATRDVLVTRADRSKAIAKIAATQ